MNEFGQRVLRQMTRRNVISWLYGDNEFSGWSGDELSALVDSVNIPTGGITVEVGSKTKRIHCHVMIEIKHHSIIKLDHLEIRNHFQKVLPANLKPATGTIYVHVGIVPASTQYTLEYIRKGQGDGDFAEINMDKMAKEVFSQD